MKSVTPTASRARGVRISNAANTEEETMTLKWSIDQAKGLLTFGKLIPMAGNTYDIQVSGQTEGAEYAFYVMDHSGEKCLARSERDGDTGAYTIAFNTTELRRNFEKEWHEIRSFHTVVSDGENTIAEGDLMICWNPVWTDPGTGEAYSMRGPQGIQGERGQHGEKGDKGDTGDPSDALVGEEMPSSPSQREMTAALKKVWTALGGTIAQGE